MKKAEFSLPSSPLPVTCSTQPEVARLNPTLQATAPKSGSGPTATMKKTLNEIAELLETELAEVILRLYELELATESEKVYIRRLLELLEELRE